MKGQVVLVLILMGNGNSVVVCCELRVYLLCVHPIYSVLISAPMMMKEWYRCSLPNQYEIV